MLCGLWMRAEEHGDLLKCERADAAPNWLPAPPAGAMALAFLGDGCGLVVMHALVHMCCGAGYTPGHDNPCSTVYHSIPAKDVYESWRRIDTVTPESHPS